MKRIAFFSFLSASLFLVGCSGPAAPEAPKPDTATTTEQPAAPKETVAETLDITKMVGQPVPPFEFVFVDGNQMKSSDFAGKVVLLDFWASWCTACKAASPRVQKWHDQYKDKGFVAIGVNTFESTDPNATKDAKINASAAASKKYFEEHKYTFMQATFGDSTADRWGIGGLPVFVLVGKDGKVLAVETGSKPENMERLDSAIQTALGS